jgi:hypothetical protein
MMHLLRQGAAAPFRESHLLEMPTLAAMLQKISRLSANMNRSFNFKKMSSTLPKYRHCGQNSANSTKISPTEFDQNSANFTKILDINSSHHHQLAIDSGHK